MSTVTLAEYLFTRLKQCGLKTMFGVPGDYNLRLLDHVEPNGLKWVGNCNELNAGYAADGYARVAGIGALITTFGVGELSAINAIAGAYTERAPVVHIVGTPPRKTRTDKIFVHHSMGDGDYLHFADMAKHVVVAQARLWDNETVPSDIDAALKKCLEEHRPVYISIPDDMVSDKVDSTNLSHELKLDRVSGQVPQLLLDKVHASKNPVIFVDGECIGVSDQINALVKNTGWPTFVSCFGKGIVNETLPNFYGMWNAETQRYRENCDLVLSIGPHFSNTNSYMFTAIPDKEITFHIHQSSIKHQSQTWECSVQDTLTTLCQLDSSKLAPASTALKPVLSSNKSSKLINQAGFFKTLSNSSLIRSGDIVMAETGTAGIGIREVALPENTMLFCPVTWLSIGYMLPASLGASLARTTRTILLIGDGSFQMTAQELSTIIAQKLNFLLILINNDGYTIERCIHGKDQRYNDVIPWNYLSAPALFGAKPTGSDSSYSIRTATARTWTELEHILAVEKDAAAGPSFSMVEVHMTREDAPPVLLDLLKNQYPDGLPEGFPYAADAAAAADVRATGGDLAEMNGNAK